MLESILSSVASATSAVSMSELLICTAVSLALGVLTALMYMYKNNYSKSFVLTLAILPAIVQIVIMLVNGNLGTGVAVMGAFSLVRFRSAPGSAREITSIFLDMATGLATGMGYIGIAVIFLIIIGIVNFALTSAHFGEKKGLVREFRIAIPESLDYTHAFDDIFNENASKFELVRVKTSNMGSLFELKYEVTLKKAELEKRIIDLIRCRNGNLAVSSSRVSAVKEEL